VRLRLLGIDGAGIVLITGKEVRQGLLLTRRFGNRRLGAGETQRLRVKLPRFRGVLRDLVQVGSALAASLAAS
jgi:hypothetical protein